MISLYATDNIYFYMGKKVPDRPKLTQRCKRFATASTSTLVAVLSWRYDVEMEKVAKTALRGGGG